MWRLYLTFDTAPGRARVLVGRIVSPIDEAFIPPVVARPARSRALPNTLFIDTHRDTSRGFSRDRHIVFRTTLHVTYRYVVMDDKEINRTLFPRRKNLIFRNVGAASDVKMYFVTVCSKHRVPNIAHQRVHSALRRAWLDRRYWMVCGYVIMPDHVHLIVAQASSSGVSLHRWSGWWKRECLIEIGDRSIVWQKGCWETRIRNEEMLAKKWEYIHDNPVRKGLVKHASDWPFMGTFNTPR